MGIIDMCLDSLFGEVRRDDHRDRPWVDISVFVLVTESGKTFLGASEAQVKALSWNSLYWKEDYCIEEVLIQVFKPGRLEELLGKYDELVFREKEDKREKTENRLADGVKAWADAQLSFSVEGRISCDDALSAYNAWAPRHGHEVASDASAFGKAMSPVLNALGARSQKSEGRMTYVGLELGA